MPAKRREGRQLKPCEKGFGKLKKHWAVFRVFICLTLAFSFAGCGLKANPVPVLTAEAVNQKAGFAAIAGKTSIMLIWKPQPSDSEIRFVDIERSELGKTETVCRDCPRTYDSIGQWSVDDVQKRPSEYRYADSDVEKGKMYSYRLNLCRDAGICRSSQVLDIEMK